jgi:TonB family protein
MTRFAALLAVLLGACATGGKNSGAIATAQLPAVSQAEVSETERGRQIALSICPNFYEVVRAAGYPAEARSQGIAHGTATVQFTLEMDSTITNIRVSSSSHPIFAAASMAHVSALKCKSIGRRLEVNVPFRFLAS